MRPFVNCFSCSKCASEAFFFAFMLAVLDISAPIAELIVAQAILLKV